MKQELPSRMPGELFIQEMLDKKGLDEFSKREDIQKWIEKAEEFGRGSGVIEKVDNSNG